VTITNTGTTTRTLTGWTVRDLANHVYTIPSFKLGAGKSVRLHTGKGTNSSTDLYWAKAGTSGTTPAPKPSCVTAPAPKPSCVTAPAPSKTPALGRRQRHQVLLSGRILIQTSLAEAIGVAVRSGRGRVSARSRVVQPWPQVAEPWLAGSLSAPFRPQLPRRTRRPGLR
jgi:Lamin Tail Domain